MHLALRRAATLGSVARPRPGVCQHPARHQQRQRPQQQQHRQPSTSMLRRQRPCAAASDDAGAASDDGDGLEPCAPAFVFMSQEHPHYTCFSIDVSDYPGLLRVITWVMNGLGCRVHNAVLRTTDDGAAQDSFWVTDLRGRKLSDAVAADVAERLEDYVSYCAPPAVGGEFTEYACGDITISNLAHPQWTVVTITAELFSPGLLLELSSIFHGQGLSICEAVIRGGSDSPIPPGLLSDPAAIPDPPPGKRVMRFWLREGKSGRQLDYSDVSALLYTLRIVLGSGNITTRPPNSELSTLECECDAPPVAGSGLRSGFTSAGSSDSDEAGSGKGSSRVKGSVSIA